jgi:hypothetical protein
MQHRELSFAHAAGGGGDMKLATRKLDNLGYVTLYIGGHPFFSLPSRLCSVAIMYVELEEKEAAVYVSKLTEKEKVYLVVTAMIYSQAGCK